MADKVIAMFPAEAGWRAIFGDEDLGEETARSRVVAWALVGSARGAQRLVGMIVDPNDPTEIVPAPDAVSPYAGSFNRYGYVGR